MTTLSHPDTEAIERATLAAVPPARTEEIAGWLLALDGGTVGRAKSAVPLRHAPLPLDSIAAVEERYRAHGLAPLFRLPRLACFEEVRSELRRRGYSAAKPTRTQIADAEEVGRAGEVAGVELATAADDAWAAVFLGEGFDPVDGECRVHLLRRGRETLYASVQVEGRIAAVGSGCFSQGWCGIHGMRTVPAFRGRGLAGSIVAALGREARRRGMTRVFLQVEEENRGAQSLYQRAGFATAWAYDYWRAV